MLLLAAGGRAERRAGLCKALRSRGRGCSQRQAAKDGAAALCFPSDLVLEVVWGFLPKILAPNRPRTLQQGFAAVPIVREQPGDSVSRRFLGVARSSCAVRGTGGSRAGSPTKLNQDAQLALQGAPGWWPDQPSPPRERTWMSGYQHSHVRSLGHRDGACCTPQHGFGEPQQVGEQ